MLDCEGYLSWLCNHRLVNFAEPSLRLAVEELLADAQQSRVQHREGVDQRTALREALLSQLGNRDDQSAPYDADQQWRLEEILFHLRKLNRVDACLRELKKPRAWQCIQEKRSISSIIRLWGWMQLAEHDYELPSAGELCDEVKDKALEAKFDDDEMFVLLKGMSEFLASTGVLLHLLQSLTVTILFTCQAISVYLSHCHTVIIISVFADLFALLSLALYVVSCTGFSRCRALSGDPDATSSYRII